MPRLPTLAMGSVLTVLAFAGPVPAQTTDSTPSFLNDVIPLFTRLGCSQGACHGKGAGQNGFRLSLRGYAPEQDHDWLTQEFAGRRVSVSDPASSPLLRKACGEATHQGGKLIRRGDRAYNLLLAWIRAG